MRAKTTAKNMNAAILRGPVVMSLSFRESELRLRERGRGRLRVVGLVALVHEEHPHAEETEAHRRHALLTLPEVVAEHEAADQGEPDVVGLDVHGVILSYRVT